MKFKVALTIATTSGSLRSILPELKRGNLPPTRIKSPRRVSINLPSRTSTRLTRALAAASLISLRRSKLSTAARPLPEAVAPVAAQPLQLFAGRDFGQISVGLDAERGVADVGRRE